MLTVLRIAGMILSQFGSLLLNEFFWITILIMIFIYKKSMDMEVGMLGKSHSLLHKALSSAVVGLAGGLLGSLLTVLIGISIADYTKAGEGSIAEGLSYIWVIALFLAFLNPRYLCFSYSGGIICLISLVFGYPRINVPGLLALIGILHLIESFLIWLDGHSYSLPMFLKGYDGRMIGGYYMNRIWPIPLAVFAVILSSEGSMVDPESIINMPDWWPLLKHSAAAGNNLTYMPLMIPVILGYGDIAITKAPAGKCRSSATRLAGYSLILITLSLIASKIRILAFAAAIFAPLAHELLIIYGTKEEEKGEPYFANGETGLKVLHVEEDKAASAMGIEPGDTILNINGTMVYGEEELAGVLGTYPSYIWIDIKKANNKAVTVEHSDYRNGIGDLGVITIPRNGDFYYEINRGGSPLKKMAGLLRKKR